ncbi:MAG: hypothetical protein M1377_02760 [Deltaproteobacteria bacterium]|nr:hypothetical protein [Deltaproteobacteria bacterium]MDA8178333.1 hypothetical protein [Deltaproteobacteria bacterium]
MNGWWNGFIYGALAVSVVEVVLFVAVMLWIGYQDRKAARRIEERLFRYVAPPPGPLV